MTPTLTDAYLLAPVAARWCGRVVELTDDFEAPRTTRGKER